MQTIWLIRHGKSSRPFGVVDHQRPLAGRAASDAQRVRRYLADAPQRYVPSTALRAVETAQLLAGECPIEAHCDLYQASVEEFLAVIDEVVAACDAAAFVAHNPTVTLLINHLAGRRVTDNVPTLGVAAFARESTGGEWQLQDYRVPKALR